FIDPSELERQYATSPAWLRRLLDAWADGLNCYLRAHPETRPKVIRRFEPWMALSFSEGSIGGDISQIPLEPLQAFYGQQDTMKVASTEDVPLRDRGGGSNGIALAPANTANHRTLLLINPHTSFYFRSELQMTSDAGLDAYGAATWGQFFLYQGFNERVGWMHTSSGVDNIDEFSEQLVHERGRLYYRYGAELRPVAGRLVTLRYRLPGGGLGEKTFTTYRTHHGPIVAEAAGRWISTSLMQKPVAALSQSFLLTKARSYAAFMKVMELEANSSNNTIFADADGDIAYLHPQFVPRRDDRFDYTRPVDGSDPATDWKGLHTLAELPHVLNPAVGWVMNTNDWPYSAAGPDSPKRADYPRYMDTSGENPRGVHATMLLTGRKDFTVDSLNQAAFDSYLPAFARLIPGLVAAHDALSANDPLRERLAAPIDLLRHWDYRWSVDSVPTSLAVLWGDELWVSAKREADTRRVSVYDVIDALQPQAKLAALSAVTERLERDFGNWHVPWGEINRYQRLDDNITPTFNDASPSLPVGFTASRWGSLASFDARRYPGTRKYYGTVGNSFVAIVEFGKRVRARAVSTGGASGDPQSPHFNDQAQRYTQGALRDVYFYPTDLVGHTQRTYHPADRHTRP
ncbi:MAG TPA: penicillin acylase family protein, partial [Steroidobacteraceae bacterium]|nr:penicillin acylase family protein [Steroidobacteraceae bacterium]